MAYIIIDDPSGYASFYEVPREVYDYIDKLREEIDILNGMIDTDVIERKVEDDKTRIQS